MDLNLALVRMGEDIARPATKIALAAATPPIHAPITPCATVEAPQ